MCSTTLDLIVPLKKRSTSKTRLQPWLYDRIQICKRECRKAERRWKKSGQQVHFAAMKEQLLFYNRMVINARSHYNSELISANQHNPRFLFKTVNQLVNPAYPSGPADSAADCKNFLLHFAGKVELIRLGIAPSPTFLDIDHSHHDSLSAYQIWRASRVNPWSYLVLIIRTSLRWCHLSTWCPFLLLCGVHSAVPPC